MYTVNLRLLCSMNIRSNSRITSKNRTAGSMARAHGRARTVRESTRIGGLLWLSSGARAGTLTRGGIQRLPTANKIGIISDLSDFARFVYLDVDSLKMEFWQRYLFQDHNIDSLIYQSTWAFYFEIVHTFVVTTNVVYSVSIIIGLALKFLACYKLINQNRCNRPTYSSSQHDRNS